MRNVVRDVLLGWGMQVLDGRPVVRITGLKRTSSPDEVVEIRRRMARKTNPMAVQETGSDSADRAMAELLYLESCDSAEAVGATSNTRKLAIVGASVTATAALLALGVALAG